MKQHTKEPWATDGRSSVGATGSDQFNGGYFTAKCEGPDAENNARRIVACVNACDGIPDESLKSWMIPPEGSLGSPHGTWAQQLAEMGRQRAELMEALKKSSAADDYFYMREVINEAIAKAEAA